MQNKSIDHLELRKEARKAKEFAYAPYSHFRVGAAVLADSGKVYTGCNIENASYGATNCAERTAIFNAVSQGDVKILAVAIASDSKDFTPPCGICRQVMSEFMAEDALIILENEKGEEKTFSMKEILPLQFQL